VVITLTSSKVSLSQITGKTTQEASLDLLSLCRVTKSMFWKLLKAMKLKCLKRWAAATFYTFKIHLRA